jgi:hypothetical protein
VFSFYIFTFLIFRELNKPQSTRIKQQNVIGIRLCIGYSTIETKEAGRIGYNGFLFPHSYSGDGFGATHLGLHLSTYAEKETHYIQYGPLLLFQ